MHLFPGVLFTFGTCAGWMQLWEAVTFGMQLARIACAAQHLAAYAGLHPHAPILPGALLCEHRGPGAHLRKIAGPDLDGQKDGKGKKEKGDKTKRGQPEAGSKKVMTIEQAFGGSAAAKAGEDGQKRGVKLGRGDQAQDVAGSSPRKGQQQGAGKGKGHGSKSAAPPTPPTLPITSFFRTGGSIIQQGH
eukprot:1143545-Pelagomonas_calceolata.AAC.1